MMVKTQQRKRLENALPKFAASKDIPPESARSSGKPRIEDKLAQLKREFDKRIN